MFQRMKDQTVTWKTSDLQSHGPHEMASWQVKGGGTDVIFLLSIINCFEIFAKT